MGHGDNGDGVLERFEEFWRAYPRKEKKQTALKAWLRLKPTAELLERILAAIAWQRTTDQWLKEGGEFIPHPSTWLTNARWQDEPTGIPRLSDKTIATGRAMREFLS